MSFAAIALRMTTVRALRGRTIAGDNITDSALAPIEKLATDKSREYPFVGVYSGPSVEMPAGLDLFASFTRHTLAFEIGVAQHQKLPPNPEQPDGEEGWALAPSDASMALLVSGLDMQIRRTLLSPTNPWSDLWLRIVTSVEKIATERGGDGSAGVKFAAQQTLITHTMLRDPTPGRPLGPVWTRFFELAATDPDLSPEFLGHLHDIAVGSSETWPEYARLRAGLGLSHGHMTLLFPALPRADP